MWDKYLLSTYYAAIVVLIKKMQKHKLQPLPWTNDQMVQTQEQNHKCMNKEPCLDQYRVTINY